MSTKGNKKARTFLHGKMKEYAYSKGKFASEFTQKVTFALVISAAHSWDVSEDIIQ